MNILYILLALLIFGALITIHELGHFIVARLCGVRVLEFAIGMGPKILSRKSRKSGTVYSLRLFPIGGFVSMLGENGMEAVQGSAGAPSDASAEPQAAPSNDHNDGTAEKDETSFWTNHGSANDNGTSPSEQETPDPVDPEEAKHAYCNQSVWKRILISLAGPFMNVLLGFLLMFVFVLVSGHAALGTTEVAGFYVTYIGESVEGGFQKDDYLISVNGRSVLSMDDLKKILAETGEEDYTVVVTRLNAEGTATVEATLTVPIHDETLKNLQESLSAASGLKVGDKILKVNSTRVHTYNELAYELMFQGYQPMKLTVERDGETVVLDQVIVPSYEESGVVFGTPDFRVWREPSFGFGTIVKHTWFRSVSTVKMVFDSLKGLFTRRFGFEAISGPVGITKTIGDAAQTGALNVLYLVIVISINLGIMNLLPLPALDGGHIFLYLIELIRRKPVKKEVEAVINFVGLILLLALAVVVAIKDVITL